MVRHLAPPSPYELGIVATPREYRHAHNVTRTCCNDAGDILNTGGDLFGPNSSGKEMASGEQSDPWPVSLF